MINSKTFGTDVSNVPMFTTDAVFYFETFNNWSVSCYYDNGAGGDAHLYVPWDTSGASDINTGHTTATSPLLSESYGGPGTYYAAVTYQMAGGYFSVSLSPGAWSAGQMQAYLKDTAGLCVFLSTNSSSAITLGSSGTVSVAANGGANWILRQT